VDAIIQSMASIKLDKLSIGYTHNRQQRPVMSVFDAMLESGEFIALIGANGAGKSTLLRTLSAFQDPLSGTITYPDGKSHRRKASELATQMAVVLTDNRSINNLTVREVVALGRVPYTNFIGYERKNDEMKIARAMHYVDISHLAQRSIETLSDGERQKCMIAKALAQETPVILLDEPTSFLDFGSKVQLFRLLRNLAHEEKKAILISTHDIELALQLTDKLWLIHNGDIYTGSVDELVEKGILQEFIENEGIHYNVATNRIEIEKL
jgi:iron complex transport system ATP-binding protein